MNGAEMCRTIAGWAGKRSCIENIEKAMQELKKMSDLPQLPYVPNIPFGVSPIYDNSGGYFEKGAYKTVDFKEFIKMVFNKSLPKTFEPTFTHIYLIPDGAMIPVNEVKE